jgi:hypothetical protein
MAPRSPVTAATALLLVALALAALTPTAVAMTLPDQAARMIAYRDAVRVRSPSWAESTRDWTCGAEPVCDICGNDWQGRWQHISCRGKTRGWGESGDGTVDGIITSLHSTSANLDGAIPKEMCVIQPSLRQLDIGGRSGAGRLVGPIEPWIADCFGEAIEELDLSMNRLTGTLPPALALLPRLSEVKVEGNNLVGTIPPEFGTTARVRRLQLERNYFEGTIPRSFDNKNTSAQLTELHLASNNFTGDLRPLRGVRLFTVTVHDNPGLCGMVPAGVRYAAGYNPEGTRLGQPC